MPWLLGTPFLVEVSLKGVFVPHMIRKLYRSDVVTAAILAQALFI
jgi:hypothetical protein